MTVVVYSASGDNGNVGTLTNFKGIINLILQAGLGNQHRNMHGFVFRAWFDNYIYTRLVLFRLDHDVR